ncbi:hypothetical protein COO60DRAFT_1466522 [Scenedesmus sp. NREL 46B-D3]|nr:hypothetical protein COO60DRAFT_1466522 [Scenedesmus sp. NREL 46B-D3]
MWQSAADCLIGVCLVQWKGHVAGASNAAACAPSTTAHFIKLPAACTVSCRELQHLCFYASHGVLMAVHTVLCCACCQSGATPAALLRLNSAEQARYRAAAGLDFEEHFLRIRPQLLVVTEDDKYGQAKRDLCAQVGAQYVILPKDLDYQPISTTQILANIRAPSCCPLRVDFGGDWPFEIGGGLGGSAAHALLHGRNPVQSELDLGVGWQDPAVIKETGLCVWHSGASPLLDFKVSGSFLLCKMALLWTGKPHVTYEKTDLQRDYNLIEQAGSLARQAVLPGQESLQALAAAVAVSYRMQLQEGMDELPEHGELAKKYCGGGWGGYALYMFGSGEQRDAFVHGVQGTHSIEPYIQSP